MRRYRLRDLPEDEGRHIFSGVVDGAFITGGAMNIKAPGHKSHAAEPRHVHDSEEIFVILQGKAYVRLDDGVEALTAGDVAVIQPGENHHLEGDVQEPCINLYIHCGDVPHPEQQEGV